jgi:hypothetical protein
LLGRPFDDDIVEPFAQVDACATCGLLSSVASLLTDPSYIPCSGSAHPVTGAEGAKRDAIGSLVAQDECFDGRGEQIVKEPQNGSHQSTLPSIRD